jgi:uncharacterized RDD family membrane protein YckC
MSDQGPNWPGSDDAGAPGTPPPAPPPSSQPPPPSGAPGGMPGGAPQGSQAGQPADLWIRFAARLIDAIIIGIVSFVIIIPIVIGLVVSDGATGGMGGYGFGFSVPGLISSIIGAALTIGYFAWFESARGMTLGKQLLNLRVVGPQGGNPTMEQAFKRNAWYLLAIIPFLGGLLQLAAAIYIAVTISGAADKRGWHDQFAGGTAVIRTA